MKMSGTLTRKLIVIIATHAAYDGGNLKRLLGGFCFRVDHLNLTRLTNNASEIDFRKTKFAYHLMLLHGLLKMVKSARTIDMNDGLNCFTATDSVLCVFVLNVDVVLSF